MTGAKSPVAIVAGASSGIGEAVCCELVSEYKVVGLSRRHAKAADVSIRTDCTHPDEVEAAIEQVVDRFGRIDVFVHSIGDIPPPADSATIPPDRWRRTMTLCLESAQLLAAACAPHVAKAKGSMIFVSSVAAFHPYPGIADYCAAKAGLEALMRAYAVDLAPHGARALAIAPAVVDTRILDAAPFSREEAASFHRLGRVGTPSEVAANVRWLTSGNATWMTGSVVRLDGGMTL